MFMPEEINLKRVSNSKFKKSNSNVAIYETDNGLTLIFTYSDDGYIDDQISLRWTKTNAFNETLDTKSETNEGADSDYQAPTE